MPDERTAPTVLALAGAAAAAAVCAVCLSMGGGAARAWLGAAFLCAAAPIGAIGLSMMLRLIPGPWREALAPPLSAGAWLLVGGALALAPVLVAPALVYPWVGHPDGGAFRQAWLSQPWFLGRSVVWFALLGWLALRLRTGKGRGVTAVLGLLVYVPFSTLVGVDWLQSLDPDFSSSGFGLYVLSLEMHLALALAVAAAARDATEQQRDVLGGVLFTALALWAYLGFMQYFILWAGNLPAGAAWYRRHAAWAPLAWGGIALKAGPGAALIFGHVRRDPRALTAIALASAAGAVPEAAWLALPAKGSGDDLGLFAASAVALAAMGYGLYGLGRARGEAAT